MRHEVFADKDDNPLRGAAARAEMQQDRRDVVRERAVLLAHAPQRATYDDVPEEAYGDLHADARLDDRGKQAWVIEERVDPLLAQSHLGRVELASLAVREQSHGQLRVVSGERRPYVAGQHAFPPEYRRQYSAVALVIRPSIG